MLVDRHPDGVEARMDDGESFVEAVLTPSILYADLVRRLLDADVPVSYFSHITGHGFLKVMRPLRPLTYRPARAAAGPAGSGLHGASLDMDPSAAYTTLNMGAGWAVYPRPGRRTGRRDRPRGRAWRRSPPASSRKVRGASSSSRST